jgi:hypothetical protein
LNLFLMESSMIFSIIYSPFSFALPSRRS